MRDFVQMRQDGVRLASECIVTLQRIQATTTDKGPSLILAVEWLDEVDEKLAKARRMLRQAAAHARRKARIEETAKSLPVVTETMWRRLPPRLRSQLSLLQVRKDEVIGKPGGTIVQRVLPFNLTLAASIVDSLAVAAAPMRPREVGAERAG